MRVALEELEAAHKKVTDKLSHLSTRNINKRIKRRDMDVSKLVSEKLALQEKLVESAALQNVKTDLEDAKAQLDETKSVCAKLEASVEKQRKERHSLVKKVWYRDKKVSKLKEDSCNEEDIAFYKNRAEFLDARVKELHQCIALCEDKTVTTYEDGRYTNTVRELIMELLSLNVSISKVNQVIRSTLKKMANIEVGRLPAKATTSKLITEARVLADIEVGLAMKNNEPETALGNIIHGDGTTKFHKKYQNFQSTVADGTSRSTGLMEMRRGDTAAVVAAFEERMMEIAEAIETVEGEEKDKFYKELMSSVTATMTDQGPTMPQFSEKLAPIRETLLPSVVENWKDLPPDLESTCKEFCTFFCKMHPIINFAEEVNKTLKLYEDIATSGKNLHTLLTAEAGVTRLVRTASKAFHTVGPTSQVWKTSFLSFLRGSMERTTDWYTMLETGPISCSKVLRQLCFTISTSSPS